MIDLELLVVFDGEKVEVGEARASDIVAAERQFAVAFPRLRSLTFEQTCFLVWRALRRAGTIGPEVAFDDAFLDRIDDIEQRDRPFDPPVPEPSDAPSPDSPTAPGSTPPSSSTPTPGSST